MGFLLGQGEGLMMLIELIFWVSAGCILHTYVFYYLTLVVIDRFFPAPKFKQSSSDLPFVSIIIAAYNEEKVIKSRIENCLSLDYPTDRLEIIIASDGSDDKTNDIVRQYKEKGIDLYDYKPRRGKVNVLNRAVEECSHNIIVFSDANTMFKRDAVRNLVRHFADERIGCVCGGLQFVNAHGGKSGVLEGFYWKYETILKKLIGRRGALLGVNGGIFAIRRELFEKCPSDTIVEDFVIGMKVLQKGYAVVYDPMACALEEATQKFIHEKERRIRIGAGDYQALFRLLPMLNPFKGLSAFAFLSHKVLRWLAPFFMITAFISNALLLEYPYYDLLFAAQCTFYLCAVLGQVLSRTSINIKFLGLCYYFVSMNYALLLGFFRYIRQTQKVAWNRTER